MAIKDIFVRTKSYIALMLGMMVVLVWVLALESQPVPHRIGLVRVSIASGDSVDEIAKVLADKELIRSPLVFLLTCRISGLGDKLKPGAYEFNTHMSMPQIIKQLVNGESVENWVTFPEGFTVRQMADLLHEKQLVDTNAFLRYGLNGGSDFPQYAFVSGENLEGYLFPDTYLIARGTGSEAIITKMLDTFDKKVAIRYRSQLDDVIRKRLKLGDDSFAEGLHKIVTMASLVEREAKTEKDRKLIAQVLWNRLDKNMKLDVDATVTYSPGKSKENKKKLYYKDLKIDSPYNTYKYAGLPPTPICNPGAASIKAVLDPAVGEYLYYVAKKDGSHVFSRTVQEHDAAKAAIENGKL